MRVSKGSSRSDHSSPPTPQDLPHDAASSPSAAHSNGFLSAKSTSPVLLNSPARRGSLSRSESYPVTAAAEERTQNASAPRSFQRVASGSAISSNSLSTAITPASLRASAPMSNGLRGTARKVTTRSGPQRMTMEQYREMDEKLKIEDHEKRMASAGENREWEREEKENITDAESGSELGSNSRKRPAGHSPRLSSRSASASHIERITSALPARGLMSRAPLQVPGRQILPGPNRAGRILMGAKYGVASGVSSTGFDKISEVEAVDGDLGAVVDFYGREETYTGRCHAAILSNFSIMYTY